MKFLLSSCLLLVGLTAVADSLVPGGSPSHNYYQEALEAHSNKMLLEAIEHPIQPGDINSAALTSLEQSLSAATAQHDKEGLTLCLRLLEQIWTQAVAFHNTEAINRIEADEFICTDMGGAVTHKSDDLAAAKSDALQLADFKLEDVKVDLYGETAVLTGKTTFSGSAKGQPFGGSYRWTDVFVQRGGHWQVVASQGTNIIPPEDK